MIHNIERYKNCFCNKDGGDNVVDLLEYKLEKTIVKQVYRPEIIFLIQGGATVAMEGLGPGRKMKKGELIFAPAGTRLAWDVEPETTLLVVRISGELPECPAFSLNRPTEHISSQKEPGGVYALSPNRRIRTFVSELILSLGDGFRCRHFFQGESSRLLFLLHAYYSEEERMRFFSHILTPDIKFSEFVRMNHMKYRTITELSDALCMTSQAFSNRFKKVFGMTPHKWMQQEKARHIYLDICRSDMPLKEIAIKYDFPLSSNFFRFCKQTFGESPGNIRKCLHKNMAP